MSKEHPTRKELGWRRWLPWHNVRFKGEWMRGALRSRLFRRVLPLVLLVAGVPLVVLGILNWISINGLHFQGITLNPRQAAAGEAEPATILAVNVHGIKDLAVEGSYNALVERALKTLELRAMALSRRVAGFLEEREQDLLALAALEPSAETYIAFSQAKRGTVWTRERSYETPLYKEIVFVDPSGQELIRIVDEREMPESALRDVSQPENTTYLRETYFADCAGLGPGEVHIQRLMGWYLPKGVAYAHAENPDGQRYQGVVRYCTPVYENGQKQGLLVLSLDWTHATELVAHVVGSDEGYVDEIGLDPDTGRLREIHSYLVGDDGWTLYHARNESIVGLDGNGEYVKYLNAEDIAEQGPAGMIPVKADHLGFLGAEFEGRVYPHPWPGIAQQNREGVESAYVPVYFNKDGVPKAMAWATVQYHTPPFNTPAGFGWVGISIDAAEFTKVPSALGAQINRQATSWNVWIYGLLGILTLYAVATISYVIYRMVSQPVGNMLQAAQRIARGDLTPIETVSVDTRRQNELTELEAALAQMVEHLRDIITRIRGAALHIGTSSEQIKAVLTENAGVANDSASAVTETTSTMEELAIIAAQIAERSGSVVETAARTQQDAQAGVQAVDDTAAKLEEIRAANESNVQEILALGRRTRRIGEVMELIDNIASRTKLIAFNAALEAAAAGESGRRFGVVAMEVRRLADNVVESTDEIRERVAEIQASTNALVVASEQEAKRIAEGVARGQEADQALTQIADSSQSTTMAAEQISLSTQQQRTAADQVVDAVRSIQSGSQAVATGSQEATRVIADLVQLADELQQTVRQFDLGDAVTQPMKIMEPEVSQ